MPASVSNASWQSIPTLRCLELSWLGKCCYKIRIFQDIESAQKQDN